MSQFGLISARARDWASNIIVLIALGVSIRLWLGRAPNLSELVSPDRVDSIRQSMMQFGHRIGPEIAPIDVAVFEDYECEACRSLERSLVVARSELRDSLAVTYLHLPLPQHQHAAEAARAVDCAARYGTFESLHSRLFDAQELVHSGQIARVIDSMPSPNRESINACLAVPKSPEGVKEAADAIAVLGISGTPTLLIRGQVVRGAPPTRELLRLLRGKSSRD